MEATKLYDKVIGAYESAVARRGGNELLWTYNTYPLLMGESWDTFSRGELPKSILWAMLGEAYYRKGDGKAAVRSFEQALEADPKAAWVQSRIAKAQKYFLHVPLSDVS